MNEILPGLKGMLNVHPVFVHFPIALWIGAMLVEALAVLRSSGDWHRTAARLLYLGTLFGLLAAATGLLAQNSVPDEGPAHDVMELHEKLMLVTTSAAVGCACSPISIATTLRKGNASCFLPACLR